MKFLAPQYFAHKVQDIRIDFLKEIGVKYILLDLDNTIVARNSYTIPEEIMCWLESLKNEDFKIYIISNSLSRRVKKIAGSLNIDGVVAPAQKPMLGKIKKIIDENRIPLSEAVIIGDQVFTDVLIAKRLGVPCILVKPISKSDLPHTKMLRYIERVLLDYWLRRLFTKVLGDRNV